MARRICMVLTGLALTILFFFGTYIFPFQRPGEEAAGLSGGRISPVIIDPIVENEGGHGNSTATDDTGMVDEDFPNPFRRKTRSPTSAKEESIPGTPKGVPHTTDCAVRGVAFAFGKSLLPQRGTFKTLYDALILDKCPGTVQQTPRTADAWRPPTSVTDGLQESMDEEGASVIILFVDPARGKDSHSGSKEKPLQTLGEALARVAKSRATRSEVILREGKYYVPPYKPLLITKAHNGMTIRNSPGERAVITGAERLKLYHYDWTLVSKNRENDYSIWSATLKDMNSNFEGLRLGAERMVRAKTPNGAPEQSQHNFASGSDDQFFARDGKYERGWFSTKDVVWEKPESGGKQHLRLPSEEYAGPIPVETIESGPHDWPNVNWPKFKPNPDHVPPEKKMFDPMIGAGGHGPFMMGVHGACTQALKPPIGYFCAKAPPRGEDFSFRAPSGVTLEKTAKSEVGKLNDGAVLVAWRGGLKLLGNPRWFAWTWKISSWKEDGDKLKIKFDPRVGGNQGAQGADEGDYFYIENLKSALDEPGEYYFDPKTSELFIVLNGTHSRPSGLEEWSAVRSKELIRIVGSKKDPVRNIAFLGIEFRDTALTWFDPHAAPTGGDWTLPRIAAVSSTGGVDGLTVKECLFERIDGSAILLDGYARNVLIERNEFAWIGASAIVSWGQTSNCLNSFCTRKVVLDGFNEGPDGRQGNQPRGTKILSNLFRELGVFVKQSAAYFSALSGQSLIEGNVMFNAPRSMINFNDGFLGGDVVRRNLLLNAVRESADHGPINLWDRVPYIWEGHADGRMFSETGTVIPLTRLFQQNFIIANHASQAAVDSDDGASHLSTTSNVFVFGAMGLKSDFGGREHASIGDLYLFVQSYCFLPTPKLATQPLQLVFKNNTCIINGDSPFGYGSKCLKGKEVSGVVDVAHNRVAWKHGPLRVCDEELLADALKRHPELDPGTVELPAVPANELIVQWMKQKLGMM